MMEVIHRHGEPWNTIRFGEKDHEFRLNILLLKRLLISESGYSGSNCVQGSSEERHGLEV